MKIAYITSVEILGSQNTGGIQCCNRNLSLLKQAFGEDNVFVCAITKHKEFAAKSYGNTKVFFSNRRKINILKYTLSGRLQFGRDVETAVLEHIKNLKCDVVFIEFSRMGFLQERLPKDVKQVLFLHNIEVDYIKNLTRVHPPYIVLKRAVERNETLALKNADVIMALNSKDADRVRGDYNRTADLILPITMNDSFNQAEMVTQKTSTSKLQILFIGSLFPPNEQGVLWFVNEVMPRVNAEFTVVGRGFEKLKNRLNRNNVNIIGTVDKLSEYYHEADAVVSPILFGAGMKVKTAEAMMYGKTMFATDEALEGYEVEGQKNIFRCNTAPEFIEAINAYADSPQYKPFDEEIRALFLEKYHTPKYVPVLQELFERLII